jgi:hypothetical protein
VEYQIFNKKCLIPEDLRILALFQICEILILGPPKRLLFGKRWEDQCLRNLVCHLRTLRNVIMKTPPKKFLRLSECWHSFQIFETPLLGAL